MKNYNKKLTEAHLTLQDDPRLSKALKAYDKNFSGDPDHPYDGCHLVAIHSVVKQVLKG